MESISQIECISGVVTRVAAEPRTAQRGGYLFRGLELSSGPDNGRIFLIFPIFAGDRLYEFPLLCWEGAHIAAYGLEVNNRLEDGTVIYHATPDSELLVEPHRPVNVTEAVQAAECLRAADVMFRTGRGEPLWMAKGKLIHTFLDHLVHDMGEQPAISFEEAWDSGLGVLKESLLGSGITVREEALEQEARRHFSNMLAWWRETGKECISAEVEVDRISSRWGLKGRADTILHRGDRPAIVELKSGRVPVPTHMLQLFAYTLLFRDGGVTCVPDAFLYYSENGKTLMMDRDTESMKGLVLSGRNRVVALKRSYGDPAVGLPDTLDSDLCRTKERCLSRKDCSRLFGNSRGLKPALAGKEKEYYDRWFRLLSQDLWAAEEHIARIVNPATLPERIADGVTLPVAELCAQTVSESGPPATSTRGGKASSRHVKEMHESHGVRAHSPRTIPVTIRFAANHQVTDLGIGEEILLHRGDVCSRESFRARVTRSDDESVHLRVRLPVSRRGDRGTAAGMGLEEPEGWFVDRLPFVRPREIARQSLFDFLTTADRAIARLVVHGDGTGQGELGPELENGLAEGASRTRPSISVGEESPETGAHRVTTRSDHEDLCFSEGLASELNDDQEAAIKRALEADTYHLIHGPPGTGKTRVLARLIRICLDRGERVLVCCPTNVALDCLLVALMDLGVKDFIRVGRRSTVSEGFLQALRRIGSPPALLGDLAELEMTLDKFGQKVTDAPLVGATAYQVAAHPLFQRQRFHRAVVDEAAQLDEPSTLAPLAVAQRFVLGGDHLQLPPVVQSRSGLFDQEDIAALEQSLFERLVRSSSESRLSRLRMQYRMNQEVQDIPSRLFYENGLYPSPAARGRRLQTTGGVSGDPDIDRIIEPELPVVFVDVEGPDSGKARPEEADVACAIVESLLACGVPSHEVGIITPYRAQQSLIRQRLTRNGNRLPTITVDTVDRFQGGEREVIILSLSRSDEVTSFLADRKRLNVSLSRARSKLILLGHGPVLEAHPLFASVLHGLERIRIGP